MKKTKNEKPNNLSLRKQKELVVYCYVNSVLPKKTSVLLYN